MWAIDELFPQLCLAAPVGPASLTWRFAYRRCCGMLVDYTCVYLISKATMTSTRSYTSPVRAAAAAEKRDRVLQVATDVLRESASAANFSLDAVAKIAGVTRLTVYNQFGSRRGLLEAVFDSIALQGQLGRLRHVHAQPDPREGIDLLIRICCDFWSSDPAVPRIYEAMASDVEFAGADGAQRAASAIDWNAGREALYQGNASAAASRYRRFHFCPDQLCDVPHAGAGAVVG